VVNIVAHQLQRLLSARQFEIPGTLTASAKPDPTRQRVVEAYGVLPLAFEANLCDCTARCDLRL